MTAQQLVAGVGLLYFGSEIVLAIARRSRENVVRGSDRGSLAIVWIVIILAILGALQVAHLGVGRLPGPGMRWAAAGLAFLLVGLAMRWTAILTLRRAFTVDVAIAPDQRLVDHGLYRWLRHPSYTGGLLAFLGIAVALGDWLAGLTLLVPITAAFLYRIRVEERALRQAFGEAYQRYCRRTRRLIPFVY